MWNNNPNKPDMVEGEHGIKMPREVYEQRHGQQQNTLYPSQNQPTPNQRGRQQTTLQVQANLQMADDTWERLIRALERLESVTDANRPEQSARRANFHRHRSETPESVEDAEVEVHLQIKAFWHVVAPVHGDKKTVPWLLKDFISWLGGREHANPHLGQVDQFAIPVIRCILGEKQLNLPRLGESTETLSEWGRNEAIENIGGGLNIIDGIIDSFARNPDKQATQHTHIRGTLGDGVERLKRIATESNQVAWVNRFLNEHGTLI